MQVDITALDTQVKDAARVLDVQQNYIDYLVKLYNSGVREILINDWDKSVDVWFPLDVWVKFHQDQQLSKMNFHQALNEARTAAQTAANTRLEAVVKPVLGVK